MHNTTGTAPEAALNAITIASNHEMDDGICVTEITLPKPFKAVEVNHGMVIVRFEIQLTS